MGNLCISLIASNFFHFVVQGGGNDWAGGRPGPGHMQRDDRGFKGEPTDVVPICIASNLAMEGGGGGKQNYTVLDPQFKRREVGNIFHEL